MAGDGTAGDGTAEDERRKTWGGFLMRETRGGNPFRAVAVAVSLVLCVACGEAADNGATFTTRDSLGITIVENTAPVWSADQVWRLSAQPVLDIGSTAGDPDYEFGYAHGAVRLADGRIVVADRQTNYMSWYDAEGRFLMRAGGTGGGPGEFTQLYRLRRIAGDSLMALNPTSLTSIFTADGEYVRRFSLAPVPDRTNLWWLGRLDDNTLLAVSLMREGTRELPQPANLREGEEYARFDVPERPIEYRDSLLHMLFTMEGELIDSIGEFPGLNINARRPFPPHAAYAFEGEAFHHSPGDRIEIRTYRSLAAGRRSDGPIVRLERIVRRLGDDLAMTDSLRALHIAQERERFEQMRARFPGIDAAAFERNIASIAFPDSIPAHDRTMFADPGGHVWLQHFRAIDAGPYYWSVFDPAGRWLGVVETLAAFTVSDIGSDYVLGIWRDDLDVQHVRMYGLETNGG